jgi:hypothetical protein
MLDFLTEVGSYSSDFSKKDDNYRIQNYFFFESNKEKCTTINFKDRIINFYHTNISYHNGDHWNYETISIPWSRLNEVYENKALQASVRTIFSAREAIKAARIKKDIEKEAINQKFGF